MKMRRFVEAGLMLAIGFVLHSIMPPIILGMRPDLSLVMLFVVVMLYRDFKLTLISGIVAGIISAFTTTFPGGQLPNLIDKPLTAMLILGIILLMKSMNLNSKLQAGIIAMVGTIISGTLFLGSALLIVGLPGPFKALFLSIVLPTAVMNTIFLYILYPIVSNVKQMTGSTEVNSVNSTA
ncbi:tryptophan transporter [Selenihalanaerobacter shriftii]|uniref:Tryptophan transporter TrpP n=1 Tax=Selenihalanaerobacter shriftii TaxID=142842 RepID=A0A1T4QGI1_9FIRM|nr:tryptophan transporter [Selenihalanaerobacter shriftii]SKA02727.1 Tryptophan transporter TrpP [Selenihalanaerobacter shriftii]